MDPSSELAQMLTRATQYSDFVARYTLYKHQTEQQGVPKDKALLIASETFINYDIPTGAGLQWMNDMGILMFTKFLFRIQKVILRQFRDSPGKALALEAAQLALADAPNITDQNLITYSVVDRLFPNVVEDAYQFPIFNYLQYLWP
jgi:hypothetical protein